MSMLTFEEYYRARCPLYEDFGSAEGNDKFIDTLNRVKEALASAQSDVSPEEIDEIIDYLQGEGGDEEQAPPEMDNAGPASAGPMPAGPDGGAAAPPSM